ncbi:hypothetical protein NDU88_003681 [Pleurodeles waltl]|uniref:Uncharacterized protein n=1 Tax=Pleurodeles waltl TaxID=8319 RepID=A0AAV7W2V4_PLEWA|nr:hypothetical protein NDU88_003681 [Pleurodeles waltl]
MALRLEVTGEALSGGDWGSDLGPDRSGAPRVRPSRPGPLPALGRAGGRTAAHKRTRNTNGCGERNRPRGETRGLTWQRSDEWGGGGCGRGRKINRITDLLVDRAAGSPPPLKAPATVHTTPKGPRHIQTRN